MRRGFMSGVWRGVFVCSVLGVSGCVMKPADSFTLEVDLPANYRLRGDATYVPGAGETCTLRWRPGDLPEIKIFDALEKSVANRASFELPLTETVNGCPLVLRYMTFDVYAKSAEHLSDSGGILRLSVCMIGLNPICLECRGKVPWRCRGPVSGYSGRQGQRRRLITYFNATWWMQEDCRQRQQRVVVCSVMS